MNTITTTEILEIGHFEYLDCVRNWLIRNGIKRVKKERGVVYYDSEQVLSLITEDLLEENLKKLKREQTVYGNEYRFPPGWHIAIRALNRVAQCTPKWSC